MRGRGALAAAALATLLVVGWCWLTVRYSYAGHWSALFCIGSKFQRPAEMDRDVWVFAGSRGYDGQFYRLMAHDPIFRRGYDRYIDASRLRYRRILVPWMAWVLGAGRDEWIDGAFIACIWGFVFLGVYWTGRFAEESGRSAWWGLTYLLLPSTMISVDRMLTDLPLVTMGLGFLYFLRKERPRLAWVCAALACLCRETGVLFPLGYAGYLFWRRRYFEGAVYAAAAAPFAVWAVVVQVATQGAGYTGHLAAPFHGVLEAFPDGATPAWIRPFDYASLMGMLICWAVVLLVRDPVWKWIGAAFLCLGLFMSSHAGNRDFTHVFAYSRQYGPVVLLLLLDAISTGRWWLVAAAVPMVLRTALQFGPQVLAVLRRH